MALEHEELTGNIIGAAIEVHRHLGPGFPESVYENAIAVELRRRGIPFTRQLTVDVLYRDIEVGRHRLDLLVADEIVVELKAIKSLQPVHFAVVRSYLCAADRLHGLLLNWRSQVTWAFGSAGKTLEARRVFSRGRP